MSPLLLAILFSVIVVGGTYWFVLRLSKSTVNQMNARIQELANHFGLKVQKPVPNPSISAFYNAELKGEIKGHAFYFNNYTRSETKSDAYNSELSLSCKHKNNLSLVIYKEGFVASVQKQFGVQDIQFEDKNFDKHFVIQSNDSDYTQELLNENIRAKLSLWERQWHGVLTIADQKLHYQESGVMVNPEDLKRIISLIELFLDLIDYIENHEKSSL